jgi:hypothetical protein
MFAGQSNIVSFTNTSPIISHLCFFSFGSCQSSQLVILKELIQVLSKSKFPRKTSDININTQLKHLLEQIDNPERIDGKTFSNLVHSEIDNTNNLLEKQLLYICSSIIRSQDLKFLKDISISDGYIKNNDTLFGVNTTAIKEDVYNIVTDAYLKALFGNNTHFHNTQTFDINLKDDNKVDILVEVCASVTKTKEKKHLERFKNMKTDNNWLVHGITVDDITKIVDSKIPKRKYVNFIYFFHDINFQHKKFIYRFAGSDDIKEISIDTSNKRKREDEIREEGKKEKAEEMAIKMIKKHKPLEEIIEFTELTKDEIEKLQYEIPSKQDE